MKFIKFFFSFIITIALIYALSNRLLIQGQAIPPLGKLLDPFHGFWQNAENDSLPFDQNIILTELKDSVNIHYD